MNKYSIRIKWIIALGIIFTLTGVGLQGENNGKTKPLKDIYKSGKIRFEKVLKIDFDSFPEEVAVKSINSFFPLGNKVYIGDIHLGRIHIFTADGKYLKSFGHNGRGPGDLLGPSPLTVTGDNLLVWELGNFRISKFRTDGDFVNIYRLKHKGNTWVLKSLDNGNIVVDCEITRRGDDRFFQHVSLDLYSNDLRFIKTLYKKKVLRHKFITKPYFQRLPQPFSKDVSWDTLPGNKIVVGYSGNYELEIIDTVSDKRESFSHTCKLEKVTEEDKKKFFDEMWTSRKTGPVRKGASKLTRENTEFPEYKPAFFSIKTDNEGNILVSSRKKNDGACIKYFDAFDSQGNFISEVEVVLPAKGISVIKAVWAKDSSFWALEKDDDIEIWITKFIVK